MIYILEQACKSQKDPNHDVFNFTFQFLVLIMWETK